MVDVTFAPSTHDVLSSVFRGQSRCHFPLGRLVPITLNRMIALGGPETKTILLGVFGVGFLQGEAS